MEEKVSSSRSTLYPLLWLAACFAAGILIANFIEIDWRITGGCGFVFAALAAISAKHNLAFLLLFVSIAAAGAFSYQIEKGGVAENRLKRIYDEGRIDSGGPVELEGVLAAKPEPVFDGFILKLNAEKIFVKNSEQEVSGQIKIFAPAASEELKAEYESLDLRHGSRIRFACNPEREEKYLNPGVMRRKENLDRQRIDAVATLKSPLLIEKLSSEGVFAPLAFVHDQRASMIGQFRDKFSISTAGVLIASLLGDKYFLDKPTADVFREGGTFHILVISGLHITFIGGLTLLFVGLFTKRKLWQFLVATSFLWAYTLAVGADVPVVRASIMFTVLLFSQVIYRKSTLLNALGFCALLLLAWRPSELFDPSFQLTFVSVAAIVGMAFPLIEKFRAIGKWTPTADTPFPPNCSTWLRRFCETLYWRDEVWKVESVRQIWSAVLFKSPYIKWLEIRSLQSVIVFLFEGIIVSLVVQVWLLPLLVVYFHRISPVSVLLNLWVGVFIALESFSAVAAVFLSSVSDSLASPFIVFTEIFNSLLLSLPAFFVDMDWAGFRLPVYSGPMKAVYLIYFFPVLTLAAAIYTWNPFAIEMKDVERKFWRPVIHAASAVGFLLLALIVHHPLSAPAADGKLRVDFLDVGQGDAALITFPNGQTMLIDGGGRMNYGEADGGEAFEPDVPSIGESVVSEFLWEKGYSEIDFIVATHADSDHMQGLTDIAKSFSVSKAYFGSPPSDDVDFIELNAVLTRKNIAVETIRKGDTLDVGGARIEVLYPDRNNVYGITENNASLVLRIIFGDHAFLFTGDIEKEAEADLLDSRIYLKSDVVKVPHHGSGTSSTLDFISAVKPGIAIISVGRKSMFGHPHPEVVERWTNAEATVITTGGKGTLTIVSDGKLFGVSRFVE
ncbi:MAG: ComEC/Rec2 family competence protein [Pyrinomonadaceae bacterium]